MSADNFKGIIELGDVNFKCLIFEDEDSDPAKIISSSTVQSSGILNGKITDLSKASQSIRSCIGEAEKIGNITLKKISVVFEQPEFLCTKLTKNRKINGAKIQRDDIIFLLKEGKKRDEEEDPSGTQRP